MDIKVRRVYASAGAADGFRVLVDRLWPRGLSRDEARLDLWLRDAAPSDELRRWFGHKAEKWDEFRRRYFAELRPRDRALDPIRGQRGPVTLLFAAKDELHNNAVALKEYLEAGGAGGAP